MTLRKDPKNFKPNGRPSSYKPEYCDLLRDILGQDKPACAFCAELGISEQTMDAWKKKNPQFLRAYNEGRAQGRALFMEKLNNAAWNADGRKVNNGLIHLLAINKYNMLTSNKKDKSQVEHSGKIELQALLADLDVGGLPKRVSADRPGTTMLLPKPDSELHSDAEHD